MVKKIGFIGLGIMGKPMSKNLLNAGYELIVYNRSQEAVKELAAAGAEVSDSPKNLASQVEVVITMLPDSPEVTEVALGERGIIMGAKPGSILIDMSSISPLAVREVAQKLNEKGIRMLDAPVSGGEPKAIDGTLSVMVGGLKEDFEECLPIFAALSASTVLCGEIGAGNVTKLANQIIVAGNIAAMGEALTLATKSGVDPEKLYQAIRGGLAGSAVLDAKLPLVLERKFDPGFKVKLHIKDLQNTLNTGHVVGVSLPLTSTVMEMMQALVIDGLEEADHSVLVKYFEKLANIEIKRL